MPILHTRDLYLFHQQVFLDRKDRIKGMHQIRPAIEHDQSPMPKTAG